MSRVMEYQGFSMNGFAVALRVLPVGDKRSHGVFGIRLTTPPDLKPTNVIAGDTNTDPADTLDGRGGDDILVGGAGNDTVYHGPSADKVDGLSACPYAIRHTPYAFRSIDRLRGPHYTPRGLKQAVAKGGQTTRRRTDIRVVSTREMICRSSAGNDGAWAVAA